MDLSALTRLQAAMRDLRDVNSVTYEHLGFKEIAVRVGGMMQWHAIFRRRDNGIEFKINVNKGMKDGATHAVGKAYDKRNKKDAIALDGLHTLVCRTFRSRLQSKS